jgi:hypothetical protein
VNSAKQLRNYNESKYDAALLKEIQTAINFGTVFQRDLNAILIFQSSIPSNPDLNPLSCIQLHEYLTKILTNVSDTGDRIEKFQLDIPKFNGYVSIYQEKVLTSSGNYTIIYSRLIDVYNNYVKFIQDTFEPLNAIISLLESNASPVQAEIQTRLYCGKFFMK